MPGVRVGSLRLGRIDFLVPLACISLLTVLAAHSAGALSRWVRWAITAPALLGAFAILPEYPFLLTAPVDPELRPALILGALTMAAVLLAGPIYGWLGRFAWRGEARGYTFVGLAALAAGFTVRALSVVWPALSELFNAAPKLNWGPMAFGFGVVLLWSAEAPALLDLYFKRRHHPGASSRQQSQ